MWELALKETIEFIPPSAQGEEDKSLVDQATDAVVGAVNEILTGSAGGPTFTALWRNNGRSFDKKLGIFESPNFNGAIVQDLGINSDVYPLTVYFDGIDNDIESERFYNALQTERGPWIIDHPLKGKLRLQLVSVTENINPVDDGHYTEFETEWIKPGNLDAVVTEESLLDTVLGAITAVQAAAVRLQQARSDAYAAVMSAINIYRQITGLADAILKELAITAAITQDAFESVSETLFGAIDAVDMSDPDFTDVNEATIELFDVPASVPVDDPGGDQFAATVDTYERMLDAIIELPNETVDAAATKEFSILMLLMSIFNLLMTAEFNSRPEIVPAIEKVTDIYSVVLTELDAMQTEFSTGGIDIQFFPQVENYQDIYNIYATVIKYLLSQFLNLRAEKRFALQTNRSPLEITIAEYGSMGEDDSNYDLFLKSNKLSGNEILMLPAGFEVLVYAG